MAHAACAPRVSRFARGMLVSTLAGASGVAFSDGPAGANWPQFRGPKAMGIAEGKPAPREWDVATGQNIRWKTEIPGLGLSSPIVWGDRLFITSAVGQDPKAELKVGLYGDIESADDNSPHKWMIYCLDAASGKIVWEQVACEGVPKVKRHPKSSHASSTPVTDGKHVVAFFGSEGLYCYSADGKLEWKKDFGLLDSGFFMVPGAQWGFGSSPVIHEGVLLVQVDVQKDSFIAALDMKDGREIWRTPRADVPTWSSPAVHVGPDRAQVIVNGWKHTGGYELKSGKELWKLAGGGDIPVPTPIVAHDLIYITNAHGGQAPLYAIATSASGDITPPGTEPTEHVKWFNRRVGNYMQTPIVIGDELFLCQDNGVMGCYDAKTGKRHFRERLGDGSNGFTASPVFSNGYLYYTSEEGDVVIVKAAKEFLPDATMSIGESSMATPAICDGVLYVRGRKHLYAIGEEK